MQSSLLDRMFPPSSPLLPQHDHDRGSSRFPSSSPSPSATAFHPSPGLRSTILRPVPVSASLDHQFDPLQPIDRTAKSLQRTIQSLLDAQSEGLLAGLASSNGQDDISSNGSLTPTPTMSSTTTSRKPTIIPIRQPPQKKISLRGARRGLTRSMHEFAALKEAEERILDRQAQEREDAIISAGAFTNKREGIEAEITSISSENGAQSARHIRAEATQLETQIQELENTLFETKARHRHLIDEAQQLESSVQSKLSSYNASLHLLDKDIKTFLARPPVAQSSSTIMREPIDRGSGTQSFYALNPKRRTLEMATEHWREEREDLMRRIKAVESEKTALEDGGQVWRKVVTEIQIFEKDLKAQMQLFSTASITQQKRDSMMTTLLNSMDQIMEFLEQNLQDAEAKDWKLLICCIGAELEAFREGREILIDTSGFRNREARQAEDHDRLLDVESEAASTTSTAAKALTNAFFPQSDFEPSLDENAPAIDYGNENGNGTGSTILSISKKNDEQEGNAPLLPDGARTAANSALEEVPAAASSSARALRSSSSSSASENDDPGPDFLISHT